MLRRGLINLWFKASLFWVLAAGLLYFFAFQEELRVRPAGQDATRACLDFAPCAQGLAWEYLVKAAAAGLGPPVITLLLGLGIAWMMERR